MIACPACESNTDKTVKAKCFDADKPLLGENYITRYICDNCGLIFGPMSFVNLAPDELAKKYDIIYKIVSDTYTTVDYHNFMNLKPDIGKKYLNIACGSQAHYLNDIRNAGYSVYTSEVLLPNDGYNFRNLDDCPVKKFAGIFSNNYIEHIQHPLEWFTKLNNRLESGGVMVHSTGCFNYVIERTPFHLYFWTRKALDAVCKKTGFVLEPIVKYSVPPHHYRSLRLDEIHTVSYNGESLRGEEGVRLIFRKVMEPA